jgi:hypothetical protein
MKAIGIWIGRNFWHKFKQIEGPSRGPKLGLLICQAISPSISIMTLKQGLKILPGKVF